MNNLRSYKLSFMVKFSLIVFLSFCISGISFAQQDNLEIKGSGAGLYMEHVIVSKENFYSLARTFNVPPKDIAAYNNLQLENGLNVGQVIKIPLTENNFVQSTSAASGEALVPVYHSVEAKEGLYRISVNYNKVPLASLKAWNHLESDAVSVGTPLIIGYLKVDKDQSYLVNKSTKPNNEVAAVVHAENKPEPVKPDVTPENLPQVNNPGTEKVESKNVTAVETEHPKVAVTPGRTKSSGNFSGGYFKKLYNDQVENKSPVNESGSAGVFKSTSGWEDGKYYCFNNDASPGTIIKITDNATGKSVFAKVLDAIPGIKQNEGLSVIVSNSAAEELGTGDNRFDCALSFVK